VGAAGVAFRGVLYPLPQARSVSSE
jgi:hypothetical protein